MWRRHSHPLHQVCKNFLQWRHPCASDGGQFQGPDYLFCDRALGVQRHSCLLASTKHNRPASVHGPLREQASKRSFEEVFWYLICRASDLSLEFWSWKNWSRDQNFCGKKWSPGPYFLVKLALPWKFWSARKHPAKMVLPWKFWSPPKASSQDGPTLKILVPP